MKIRCWKVLRHFCNDANCQHYCRHFVEVCNNPVSVLTNIALDVMLTMTGAHSKNMSFFNSKILENYGYTFVENKYNHGSKFFYILIIRTCLKTFKTFSNPNLVSNTFWFTVTQRRTRRRTIFFSLFSHIEILYETDKSKPQKLWCKLNKKLLHSKVMEKMLS